MLCSLVCGRAETIALLIFLVYAVDILVGERTLVPEWIRHCLCHATIRFIASQVKLCSLGSETSIEEVCAVLEDVFGLCLCDLAFECGDFVLEGRRKRHWQAKVEESKVGCDSVAGLSCFRLSGCGVVVILLRRVSCSRCRSLARARGSTADRLMERVISEAKKLWNFWRGKLNSQADLDSRGIWYLLDT